MQKKVNDLPTRKGRVGQQGGPKEECNQTQFDRGGQVWNAQYEEKIGDPEAKKAEKKPIKGDYCPGNETRRKAEIISTGKVATRG